METSCNRPLDLDDAVALIGVLAALQALVERGEVSQEGIRALRHSLEQGRALLAGSNQNEIATALGNLNTRLRTTLE